MLALYHIDRGVNVAQEMALIINNLKYNTKEFDADVATQLERLCHIISHCFKDCYQMSDAKNMSYDEIIKNIEFESSTRKQA